MNADWIGARMEGWSGSLGSPLRLRTLVVIRWIAVAGQAGHARVDLGDDERRA